MDFTIYLRKLCWVNKVNFDRILVVLIILFSALLCAWWVVNIQKAYESPVERQPEAIQDDLKEDRLLIFEGNTLMSLGIVNQIVPHTYATIIGCLESKESSGNPNAYNPKDSDGRPKYGCMQFDAETFKHFCVEKYYYRNDIWDCDIQKMCAYEMIRDGRIGHWGTKGMCGY